MSQPIATTAVPVVAKKPVPALEVEGVDHRATIASLLAIIASLQGEVLSNDLWYLAMMGAQREAEELGVTNEQFQAVVAKLEEHRKRRRARNPMSGMF